MERVRADPSGERRRLMDGFLADPDRPIAREVRAALDDCDDEVLAADYAACAAADLRGRLGGGPRPGPGDRRRATTASRRPGCREELARELPMAQMVLVPGARHMPMADADGTVNLLAAAFLARLELTLAGL